jgi:hypothetical protein
MKLEILTTTFVYLFKKRIRKKKQAKKKDPDGALADLIRTTPEDRNQVREFFFGGGANNFNHVKWFLRKTTDFNIKML